MLLLLFVLERELDLDLESTALVPTLIDFVVVCKDWGTVEVGA